MAVFYNRKRNSHVANGRASKRRLAPYPARSFFLGHVVPEGRRWIWEAKSFVRRRARGRLLRRTRSTSVACSLILFWRLPPKTEVIYGREALQIRSVPGQRLCGSCGKTLRRFLTFTSRGTWATVCQTRNQLRKELSGVPGRRRRS